MKFGIIGYGRMGKVYHEVLSHLGFELNFICDVVKTNNSIQYYNDYKMAIDESSIDGIVIATYGPSHNEIAKYAIDANIKYIVCEKPFTTSVKHADEIIASLKNSKTRLAVNYSRRFSQIYSNLKNDLHMNNIIGKPRTIMMTCGAGGLSATGTHFLDLCSYLLDDKIKSVYAISVNKNLPNPRGKQFEDPGGYVLLTYQNESRAYIDMGDDLGLQHFIEIIGEYGRIFIDESNQNITIRSRTMEDREKPKHLYGLPNPIIRNDVFNIGTLNELIETMLKNLVSESKLVVSAEMAKESVEIYSAIRKSYDTKKPVELPLDDEYYEKEFMVT
jgi:predicted dehydrogenase